MRGFTTTCVILAAWGIAPGLASAYHPLETDDAGTVEPGAAELELSFAAGFAGEYPTHRHLETALSLHLGLLPVLDLGGTFRFESHREEDRQWLVGLADPTVDLKWRAVSADEPGLGLAFRLDYEPPQSSALSSGGHDLGLTAIGSFVGTTADVHLNVGLVHSNVGTDDRSFSLYLSSGVSGEVARGLRLGGELVYELEPSTRHHASRGLVAAVWEPAPGRVLSLGAGPTWETGYGVGALVTVAVTVAVGGE